MPQHKISPYRVKLRQEHKPGKKVRTQDLWELDNLGEMNPGLRGYNNFIELLAEFFEGLRDDGYINDTVKRTLTATRIEIGDGAFDTDPEARSIEVELTYGRYNRVEDHTDKSAFDGIDESPFEERKENNGTGIQLQKHACTFLGMSQRTLTVVHSSYSIHMVVTL